MTNTPLITVIMPAYNVGKYVAEAIESILNQTFRNFEFLIFNDGSTDDTAHIIRQYADKDQRITFFDYQQNTGYLKHLNEGIDKAKGKYIARMDADDISLPERFAKQVAFMENNLEMVVVGTKYTTFGERIFTRQLEENDEQIRVHLLEGCTFSHPSVLMRAKVLKDNNLYYDLNYYPAEDYHFWVVLSKYGKLANLTDILLFYRLHEEQISVQKNEIQQNKIHKIRALQFEYLGLTKQESYTLLQIFQQPDIIAKELYTSATICNIAKIIKKIICLNQKKSLYHAKYLKNMLKDRWQIITKNTLVDYNLRLFFTYFFNIFPTFSCFSFKQKIVFSWKCLLHWKTRI